MKMQWTNRLGPKMTSLTIGLVLALGLAGTVWAEDVDLYGPRSGDNEFTIAGTGGNDENFNRGAFSLAASIGHYFNRSFELGLRHNMTFYDSDTTDASFAATTRVFSDFHLDFGRFQPFLGANIGLRYGDNGVQETGTVAPETGLKIFVFENAFLLGMAEYQFFFEDVGNVDDNADDGQFVYTVGVGLTF